MFERLGINVDECVLKGELYECPKRFPCPDTGELIPWYFDQRSTGVVTQVLKDLLAMRKAVRDKQKAHAYGTQDWKSLEGQQLATKMSANSTYGATGASKGRISCLQIGSTVTGEGKRTILNVHDKLYERYPNSACMGGDSVVGETPLLVCIAGKRHIVAVEQLEALLRQEGVDVGAWQPYGDGKEQILLDEGALGAWSDDTHGSGYFTPVRRLIRHSSTKQRVRVCTPRGIVTVTEDHSLLDCGRRELRPAQVCVGKTQLLHCYPECFEAPATAYATFAVRPRSVAEARQWGQECRDAVPACLLSAPWTLRHAFLDGVMGADNGSCVLPRSTAAGVFYIAESVQERVSCELLLDGRVRIQKCAQHENWSIVCVLENVETCNDAYVYDLETATHHFQAGIGALIVHNTDSVFFRLGHLKNISDVGRYIVEAEMFCNSLLAPPMRIEFEKAFGGTSRDDASSAQVNGGYLALAKKRYAFNNYGHDPKKSQRTPFDADDERFCESLNAFARDQHLPEPYPCLDMLRVGAWARFYERLGPLLLVAAEQQNEWPSVESVQKGTWRDYCSLMCRAATVLGLEAPYGEKREWAPFRVGANALARSTNLDEPYPTTDRWLGGEPHNGCWQRLSMDRDGTLKMKGMETVRRDACELVRRTLQRVLELVVRHGQPERAMQYVRQVAQDLVEGRIPLHDLVMSKHYSKLIYRSQALPHLTILEKCRQRRLPVPELGSRIAFLIVRGSEAKAYQRAEQVEYVLEHQLQVDYDYYLQNQFVKPMLRVLDWVFGFRAVPSPKKRYSLEKSVKPLHVVSQGPQQAPIMLALRAMGFAPIQAAASTTATAATAGVTATSPTPVRYVEIEEEMNGQVQRVRRRVWREDGFEYVSIAAERLFTELTRKRRIASVHSMAASGGLASMVYESRQCATRGCLTETMEDVCEHCVAERAPDAIEALQTCLSQASLRFEATLPRCRACSSNYDVESPILCANSDCKLFYPRKSNEHAVEREKQRLDSLKERIEQHRTGTSRPAKRPRILAE